MIYAPVTGLIGFLNYDVGNVVGGPGTQVLDTITRSIRSSHLRLDEPTYLAFSVSGKTQTANPCAIKTCGSCSPTMRPILIPGALCDQPDRRSETGTITVESRFPNPEGLLRPGGFARVRVVVERRPNAVLVPQTAIVKSQGVDTVYVVDSKNVAALRTVTLGPQYQQSFIVESGLKAGERVVVEGTQKVQPGDKVVVKTN